MTSNRTPAVEADQALLAGAASGDLAAFGVIYERYQHAVYRFACAMTGSRDAAGDITHDAFLAVLADASRFDPRRASLSTYLYGIVRNLCRQRLRRASRLQPIDAATLERPADHAGASADPVADAELAVLVRRALADLPSRYRELILLCDLHDLSYADAAQIVGASVPAVRSRLPSRATAHEGVALRPDAIAGVPPQARTVRRMTIFPGSEPDASRRAWAAFARQDARVVAPPALAARVHRSVAARAATLGPMPSAPAPVWRRWAAVAAALAAVLVSAVVLGRQPGPDPKRLPGPLTIAGESRLSWAVLPAPAIEFRPPAVNASAGRPSPRGRREQAAAHGGGRDAPTRAGAGR